jgi:hypothetical protein
MSTRNRRIQSLKSGVRKGLDESALLTKEEAEEIVSEMNRSYSVEELREQLPSEMFEAVMSHVDVEDSPSETMEEVGKSATLAKALYEEVPAEDSDATVEKGAIGTEPAEKVTSVGASHHLTGEDPFKDPEVTVSKSPGELDRFYEELEDE